MDPIRRNTSSVSSPARRAFLRRAALGGAALPVAMWQPGRFAEELLRTPTIGEGPFYPERLPLDTDNDLLVLNDAITPAVGTVVSLSGRVLGRSGIPVRNAFVEIWQVDNNGSYLHKGGRSPKGWDENFQGYGRFLTDAKGRYHFRTLRPVPYGAGRGQRAPHIHVGVSVGGRRLLTMQLLINGDPINDKDGLLRAVRDPLQRETVLADFVPIPNSPIGEERAHFDIILGHTLQERDGKLVAGVSKSHRAGGARVEGERVRMARGQTQLDRYMTLDRDGDGAIAAKELSPRMRSLLRRGDADKDARVTKKELEALLEREGWRRRRG